MEYLYKKEYDFSVSQENVEMVLYSVVCFFVPFFMGHPQIVVGVIVNAALVLGALNLRGYRLLPVIMMPSLGVLSRGLIFGPYTVFLLYMIPFIWVGNAILVYFFKSFNLDKRWNKWVTAVLGSGAKTVFLFGCAFSLVSASVLPAVFLTSMGLLQLYTALMGSAVAIGIQRAKRLLQ